MSIKANLELDNGDLETIEIEDTEYEIEFLKECSSQGKIFCGGHNEDGDTCEARLFIREKRNHHYFAKYPSSEKEHIKNCSRQKVENRKITHYSLQRYNDFLEKLLNGLFEGNDILESKETIDISPTSSNRQSHYHSKGNSSIDLKRIDNLVRAILSGNLSLEYEISGGFKLYRFFCRIINTQLIEKFINVNNKERYYYIFIYNCHPTRTGNLMATLPNDSENYGTKLFINSKFDRHIYNSKTYDILIIAKANDVTTVTREGEHGVTFFDYKINLPQDRILVRLTRESKSTLALLSDMIDDIYHQ